MYVAILLNRYVLALAELGVGLHSEENHSICGIQWPSLNIWIYICVRQYKS